MRGGEPDMSKVAALRKELGDNLDVYEYILSKQSFIGGEVRHEFMYRIEFISINQIFTLADLFHLPYGAMLVKAGEDDLFQSRPHVKQWWNKISGRPAWKSVLDMK